MPKSRAAVRKKALLLAAVLAAELLLSSLFVAAEAHHAAYEPAPYSHAVFARHDDDCHVCRLMNAALTLLGAGVADRARGAVLPLLFLALAAVFLLSAREKRAETLITLKTKLSD